jgi:hypothetical protein
MPFTPYWVGPTFDGIELEATVPDCSKRPHITYVYGTCHATSDSGCAPPLEVQTWLARHRKLAPGSAGGDVELRRGRLKVAIFADSRLARRAAHALRKAPASAP